jgi:hypothetical protein
MSEELDEAIDAGLGGYEHPETHIVEMFYRAGKTIECAHAVFPARSKSTGKWFPILMFFDQDKKEFAYAFRLDSFKQVLSLLSLLFGCDQWCAKMNGEKR